MKSAKRIMHFRSDPELLERLDPFINNLLLSGGIISFIGFLYIYFTGNKYGLFLILDLFIALFLVAVYINKGKLLAKTKLLVIDAILLSYGIVAFHMAGVFGTGIFLILTSVLLSSLFLNRKLAWGITFITSLHGLYVLYKVVNNDIRYIGNLGTMFEMTSAYVFIYIGVIIVTLAVFISTSAIKKHLYDNIYALNNQMEIMSEKNLVLKQKNEEIEYLAYFNQLTTLPNRAHFTKRVTKYMEKGIVGVLILVDMKGFHRFNAFYGMDKGDELLNFLGLKIGDSVGGKHELGYFGNNTLGVWIDHPMKEEDFKHYFEMHKKDLQSKIYFDFLLETYVVGVTRTDQMASFEDIFTVAEKAMKLLKKKKKEDLVFIDETYISEMNHFESLVNFIESSMRKKEYYLNYQEKINVDTGEVVGLEALARVDNEEGTISPNIFIPIIEDNQWATEFGQMILEKVFDDLDDLVRHYGKHIQVSINVSPQQIADPYFVKCLEESIKIYGVNPYNIELEITESILLTDMEKSLNILRRLRELGLKISIDDFGTGFSSMKYVANLPVDIIKIDKSFIDRLCDCSRTRAIVKAIIDIAHATDMLIVAEGVEFIEQVDILKTMDCKIVQGYLYSRPERKETLLSWKENPIKYNENIV